MNPPIGDGAPVARRLAPIRHSVDRLSQWVDDRTAFRRRIPIRGRIALFVTAVINGIVAPPLLILIILLGADRRIMKRSASGRLSLTLTGIAAGLMTLAAIALFGTLIAG